MILIVGAILGLVLGSALLRGAFAIGVCLSRWTVMLFITLLVIALVLGGV